MTQEDGRTNQTTPVGVNDTPIIGEGINNHQPEPSTNILEKPKVDVPKEELTDKPTGAVEPLDDGSVVIGELELHPRDPEEPVESMLVRDEDMQLLWEQTGVAQKEIFEWVTKQTLADDLLARIQNARECLMIGKSQYEEAASQVAQVEYRISMIKRIRTDSKKTAPLLFVYEIVMMILVSVGMYFFLTPVLSIQTTVGSTTVNINQFLNSILWGSMGGIVGALYALWKHTASDQDFDAHYSLWYITNPILGLALGAFTFLLVQAGFFSLTAGSEENGVIRSAYVIYLFAWVVGFKQNVVYEIVRRVLDVFAIRKDGVGTITIGSETTKIGQTD